ncbi:MAG TPA: hypothetical protein PLK12_12520 [Prolixibacteraceae bacterium]|nr:hypothetical protein [Prolixibacteraceae bacterium]
MSIGLPPSYPRHQQKQQSREHRKHAHRRLASGKEYWNYMGLFHLFFLLSACFA